MTIDKTTNTLSTLKDDGTPGANRYRNSQSTPDTAVSSGLGDGYSTSAFPRRTLEAARAQARIWAAQDLWSGRFRDHEDAYVEAFVLGMTAGDTVEGYRRINMFDLTPEQFTEEARKAGASRAAYTLRGKESDFVTQPIDYYGNHELYPFADRRMLHNPFVQGTSFTIPRGTAYSSSNGRSGVKGRMVRTTIFHSHPGYTSGSVGKLFIRPAVVTVVGAGGYYQDIIVTPELLLANGLPVYESPVNGCLQLRPEEH